MQKDGLSTNKIKDTRELRERLRRRGICVVIPTFNNVGTIKDVVERSLAQCQDVIVVNDGSTDGTAEALHTFSDIILVNLERNSGKGVALKAGFTKALALGFAYAITLDADGQHFPEDIPLMLEANMKHPGALLVGERKGLRQMERSWGSKFANEFGNFWFMVQTFQLLRDTQTGFRLYPLKKLVGLSLLTSRYEAELELMVFARWHGVRLVPVEVGVYYPPKEERVSHFRPVQDFTRIFVLNTVLCFAALLYALPLNIIKKTLTLLATLYSLLFYLVASLLVLTPAAFACAVFVSNKEQRSERLHRLLYGVARFVMDIHGVPRVKYTKSNPHGEHFEKPAVIICNHQSHLDLMIMLSMTPKLIVLTNDWVWNTPFYSHVIKESEFYPVSMGINVLIPKLRPLVDRGYSIVVYPEGTRSKDGTIGRFHKGAFHIAQTLELDVLPMLTYGLTYVLPKKGKVLHKGKVHLEIGRRITSEEFTMWGDAMGFSKHCRRMMTERYNELKDDFDQK